jgi:hypothetical protein
VGLRRPAANPELVILAWKLETDVRRADGLQRRHRLARSGRHDRVFSPCMMEKVFLFFSLVSRRTTVQVSAGTGR